uniref:DDE Tnp4 domain-containing protein n=1 Tax=Anisakis simplex TaxID=6269 RepID=A0A0M3JDT6_ANISI
LSDEVATSSDTNAKRNDTKDGDPPKKIVCKTLPAAIQKLENLLVAEFLIMKHLRIKYVRKGLLSQKCRSSAQILSSTLIANLMLQTPHGALANTAEYHSQVSHNESP